MAYWLNNTEKYNASKQKQFFMDSDADVTDLPTTAQPGTPQGSDTTLHLPCGKGSVALSIESGNVYILNSLGSWTVLGGASSSGSDDSEPDINDEDDK